MLDNEERIGLNAEVSKADVQSNNGEDEGDELIRNGHRIRRRRGGVSPLLTRVLSVLGVLVLFLGAISIISLMLPGDQPSKAEKTDPHPDVDDYDQNSEPIVDPQQPVGPDDPTLPPSAANESYVDESLDTSVLAVIAEQNSTDSNEQMEAPEGGSDGTYIPDDAPSDIDWSRTIWGQDLQQRSGMKANTAPGMVFIKGLKVGGTSIALALDHAARAYKIKLVPVPFELNKVANSKIQGCAITHGGSLYFRHGFKSDWQRRWQVPFVLSSTT
jgi:hypothetical protein